MAKIRRILTFLTGSYHVTKNAGSFLTGIRISEVFFALSTIHR